VRQAVSHAIDRDAVAQAMFGDHGLPAHTYVPPHDPAHAANARQYNGGPETSRRMLREAGYALPVPIRLRSMRRKAGTNEEITLLLVQEQLQAGGFDVTLDLVDGSVFHDYLAGTHGALLFYSQRTAKTGAFWNVPYEDNTWQLDAPARAYDEEAVRLYDAWAHTLYPERRQAISRQLQRHYAEQLPTIPLTFGPMGSVFVSGLSGWAPGAGAETAYWNVETWRLDDAE
jgi:peptide/nickel transport system substrate-binding protein